MDWVVSLPMYNVTPALDAGWKALLSRVVTLLQASGVEERVTLLENPGQSLPTLWQRPDLLLSQTCGYPLMSALSPSIQLVGAPAFDIAGCEGGTYYSVIVVSERAYRNGARSLSRCRGLRAAYNSIDSHSGYNAFRDAIAPFAGGQRYFVSLIETGSHRASLQALAENRADVAAIDCVTLAYIEEAFPELAKKWHRIDVTAAAPSLPFIASSTVDAVLMRRIKAALSCAIAEDDATLRALRLTAIANVSRSDYEAILAAQRRAVAAGYPVLV